MPRNIDVFDACSLDTMSISLVYLVSVICYALFHPTTAPLTSLKYPLFPHSPSLPLLPSRRAIPPKTQTLGDPEEDINVVVHAAKQLLARSVREDRDVR